MTDFAERVQRLVDTENIIVKRQAMKIIGSNLKISKQKIKIEPRDAWLAVKRMREDFEKELGSLELDSPIVDIDIRTQTAVLQLETNNLHPTVTRISKACDLRSLEPASRIN